LLEIDHPKILTPHYNLFPVSCFPLKNQNPDLSPRKREAIKTGGVEMEVMIEDSGMLQGQHPCLNHEELRLPQL